MTDPEDAIHHIRIGRATMAAEVLSIIETGDRERFSDGEILDAVEAASKEAIKEYADIVEEMAEAGEELVQ